jgi:hypothetical protein
VKKRIGEKQASVPRGTFPETEVLQGVGLTFGVSSKNENFVKNIYRKYRRRFLAIRYFAGVLQVFSSP